MQIRNALSDQDAVLPYERDRLLGCRMAMLGLDLDIIESRNRETINDIKSRCTRCDFQDACAVDLERDPNNPVWESYCPNSGMLLALTQTWWQAR